MRRARRLAGAGVALALVAASACSSGSGDGPAAERETALRRALASISAEGLAAHVDVLASDDYEGRQPGSGGHRRARDYLIDALARAQVERGGIDGTSYLHLYSTEPNPRYLYPYPTGHNLVGLLRGSDPVHGAESVIVMAHYDHVGRDRFRHVFNGAYDNAAGVAALIELARAFQDVGYAPKRTIVWLFTDEEETGLRGARAFANAPSVPAEGIVLALSVDPIGRALVPGYAFTGLFGLEHSPALRALVERNAARSSRGDVLITHRDLIHSPFESDQDPFLARGIPGAWLVNPGFTFYHQIADEPDTVQYDVLLDSVRLLAQLVDQVANDDGRYPFVEDVPVTANDLARFRLPVGGLLRDGAELGERERESLAALDARLAAVEASGVVDAATVEDLSVDAIVTLFALSLTHPGPIPPPFPTGATAALP